LCAVSGPSLGRYTSLAETMGLPRVVRTIEILGHALVDMREAPDAQVVLEIATVRAVRPDLDSGMEALSDRVSVLERSLSGAPAFPRPGADRPDRAAPSPAASGAGPEHAPAPTPASSPTPVSSRPSLGAVQRSKRASAGTTAPAATSEKEEAAAVAPPPAAAPSPAAAEPAATASTGGAVDRDSLTEAWGDGLLQSLPARAKARFASGRFVTVDEHGAHFALPNAAHRDQCAEQLPLVESVLASHFGTPVKLVLEIDDAAPPPPLPAAPSGPAAGPAPGAGASPGRGLCR